LKSFMIDKQLQLFSLSFPLSEEIDSHDTSANYCF